MNTYLAVDFGGGSGRIMAGSICQGTLKLEEVYRFPNRQVRMGNHVYWDFLALFDEMKNGLRQAVRKGYHIRSIGIDTWGVDFGLIDRNGNLLGTQCVIVTPERMVCRKSFSVTTLFGTIPKPAYK